MSSLLESLNWSDVRRHYDERVAVHEELLQLHTTSDVYKFSALMLGISKAAANYSADEHAIGPRVLAENINAEVRLFDLATCFIALRTARSVPDLIRGAKLARLGIGVGSEASCMLNPKICWVANTRTLWAHLVVKHNVNVKT